MIRCAAALGVLLVVAVAPAGAADVPIDPEAECGSVQGSDTAVVFLPTGERVSGNTNLYSGTTLYVVVCSGREPAPVPSAWRLKAGPGLAVKSEGGTYVEARVTGGRERIQVGGRIAKKPGATGPTIRVEGRSTVDSAINGSWQFPASGGSARTYRDAEEAYLDANRSLRSNVSRLNDLISNLDGTSPERINRTRGVVAAINRSVADVRREREDLTDRLYDLSWRSGGNGTALAAIRTLREDDAPEESARAALRSADGALKEHARSANIAIGLDLLIAALVGGVASGGITGWRIRKRASDVQYDQQFTRTRLDPSVLDLPLGIAALGVLLAVGGLAWGLSLVGGLWVPGAVLVVVASVSFAVLVLVRFEVIP